MSASDTEDPLVTRKTGVEHCRDVHGLPLTESAVEKKAMRGEGPPVAGYWGKRHLYRRSVFVAWAKALISDEPRQLGAA